MLAKNPRLELRLVYGCLALTLASLGGIAHFLSLSLWQAWQAGDHKLLAETLMFSCCMLVLGYGMLLYHLALAGNYRRRLGFEPASREVLEALYDQPAPSLAILVPAYKEERVVIWQTLLSAALAEYPAKEVVLLIDDPYHPKTLDDRLHLEDSRRIPQELQHLFSEMAARMQAEEAAFEQRLAQPLQPVEEVRRLAALYRQAADWVAERGEELAKGRDRAALPHGERFFLERIIDHPVALHWERAESLESLTQATGEQLAHEYRRLAGLFTVRFTSFERKKYVNLSHEANKSMNLSSYLALIGRHWREVEAENGDWLLQEVSPVEADFSIPAFDYVNTIDADSLMTQPYVLTMIELMQRSENAGLAAAQSPCSSIDAGATGLERIAGACIDTQFLTHQGYTHWNAGFWVGANAMLRRSALEDIKEYRTENGFEIAVYVQDRTVIEDTESSIDLVARGWTLYNYPERMTFSSTPPDFGSLLIQRRRWANGGLIILPKLLAYAWRQPKNLRLLREMFMRFNYLAATTLCCLAALTLFAYPFSAQFETPWFALASLPYLCLLARDFHNAGYRGVDALRSYALNLMLLPVITGGVLKQFQQMLTGRKIPFGRTPKVPGRTAAPMGYCLIELALPFVFLLIAARDFEQARWAKAGFGLMNASVFLYAISALIGWRALFEDITAGMRSRWRARFHQAEIIPLPQTAEAMRMAAVGDSGKQTA